MTFDYQRYLILLISLLFTLFNFLPNLKEVDHGHVDIHLKNFSLLEQPRLDMIRTLLSQVTKLHQYWRVNSPSEIEI